MPLNAPCCFVITEPTKVSNNFISKLYSNAYISFYNPKALNESPFIRTLPKIEPDEIRFEAIMVLRTAKPLVRISLEVAVWH